MKQVLILTIVMLFCIQSKGNEDLKKIFLSISPSIEANDLIVEVKGTSLFPYWNPMPQPTGVETFKITTNIPSLSLIQDLDKDTELSVKFDVSQFHAKYHPQQQPPNQLKLMLNSQTIGTVDINSGILVYRIDLKYLKEFDKEFLIFLGEPTISKFTINNENSK